MNYYYAFGLSFATDLTLNEFLPAPPSNHYDVLITSGRTPKTLAELPYSLKKSLLLNIEPVARFLIEGGTQITYERYPNSNQDELRLFLLGSCIGGLLQQRGHIVLHGNALSTDGERATLFIGHSGAGKSTIAAWHVKQNHLILADDVCAIFIDKQQTAWAIPSYPQLKLWKNSADLLNIKTASLRRVRPQDEKFALPIHEQFCRKALPLKEIIEIHPTASDHRSLVGIEKFTCLMTHSYRRHFLSRMGMDQRYDRQLMQLADIVEVRKAARLDIGTHQNMR